MIENAISTTSDIVQDISNELIFGHTHNGIQCAVNPTAKRACDRAWFSAKQIEEWSEMSKKTLWRWLERIEKARRIQSVSDMKQIKIDDENGRGHETTLYNLNVLNQLAMVEMKNKVVANYAELKHSADLAEYSESRGNTFVSLRDVLEILSKTELSSDIVDNFQEGLTFFRFDQRASRKPTGFSPWVVHPRDIRRTRC